MIKLVGLSWTLTLFLFIIIFCLHASECFIQTKSTLQNPNINKNQSEVIKVPYSEKIYSELLYLMQNKLIHSKLSQEDTQLIMKNETILTRQLANRVIDYLMCHQNEEEKITELAELLLGPMCEYGSEKAENVPFAQKISVIHNWIRHAILGKSFLDWILNEVGMIKIKEDNSLLMHGNLKRRFFNQLNWNTSLGSLNPKAKIYYQDNILIKDMPSFLLQTNDNEKLRKLDYINLSEPEFGYLHVGLKIMEESKINFKDNWSQDEIEDIGIFFESLIRQRNSIELIELFEIPAKIYYLSTLNDEISFPKIIWDSTYEEYFDYLKRKNFFIQLMEPLNNWKNRSTLARQILKKNDISEKIFLAAYLNHGDNSNGFYPNSRGEPILLPSVDNIFDEQNKNVSMSYQTLLKLMLLQSYSRINADDQKFILSAEISTVKAILISEFKFIDVLIRRLHHFNRSSLVKPPIVLEADNIDLLYCTTSDEERFYALNRTSYELHRIDPDKDKIINFYKRNDLVSVYEEIRFTPTLLLKKKEEIIESLINKLSEIYSKQLYNLLKISGFEPTFCQKFEEFLLNLIPFYTCIEELKNQNFTGAVLSCGIDMISLIPFVEQTINAAFKFGYATTKVSVRALGLVSRQASIHEILWHAKKNLIFGGLGQIQKTMNSKNILNLGREFLHGVDPGIKLFGLGGMQVFKAIKKASSYLKDKFYKLYEILKKLVKRAEEVSSSLRLISVELLDTKRVVFLPDIKQESTVVKIGAKNGKDILVRIYPETNFPFGRKYLMDPKTEIIELPRITFQDIIYQVIPDKLIEEAFLGGRKWSRWEEQIVSMATADRVNIVYRADTRDPNLIIGQEKGCWPREGIYNYNLEFHHDYFYDSSGPTSPFVSTSSSLTLTREHGKAWGSVQYLKQDPKMKCLKCEEEDEIIGYIYKIRPGSNFYNLRQSYIAARDVSPQNSLRYKIVNEILESWGSMEEYIVLNGFDRDRIIAYAPIRKSDDGTSPLKWIANEWYDPKLDGSRSASDLYTRVAMYKSDDAMDMAINIVQQYRRVNKKKAKKLIKCGLKNEQIVEFVTRFNTHKEEQLRIISGLNC